MEKLQEFHIPVLVQEVVRFLVTDPNGVYIDTTLGGGGHAEAILCTLSDKGRLIGIDRDPEALQYARTRLSHFGEKIHIVHGEFGKLKEILNEIHITQVHGIFFDLGVSSHQIDFSERGFSYRKDGPLDMRMNFLTGLTAKEIVNTYSEEALRELFFRYGEERRARDIAQAIVQTRKKQSIETTLQLAEVIRCVTSPQWWIKTVSRVFQALRIEVNDELGQLEKGLVQGAQCLYPKGRMVVLSYHSLEDRMVKQFLRKNSPVPFQELTRKVVKSSDEEKLKNPRARSARLRAAERKE